MTVSELHTRLTAEGIPGHWYYLHGLYGSSDDNDKIGLTIRRGKYAIEYETYFKEHGEKHNIRVFTDESEACEHIYNRLREEQVFRQIQKIDGLEGMTVNERLYASGLMDEFDAAMLNDKRQAKKILRLLRVDEPSIERIVK